MFAKGSTSLDPIVISDIESEHEIIVERKTRITLLSRMKLINIP